MSRWEQVVKLNSGSSLKCVEYHSLNWLKCAEKSYRPWKFGKIWKKSKMPPVRFKTASSAFRNSALDHSAILTFSSSLGSNWQTINYFKFLVFGKWIFPHPIYLLKFFCGVIQLSKTQTWAVVLFFSNVNLTACNYAALWPTETRSTSLERFWPCCFSVQETGSISKIGVAHLKKPHFYSAPH